jgi:hypothetical protein
MNNPFLRNFSGNFYDLENKLFEQVYIAMGMFANLPSVEDCKKDERIHHIVEDMIKIMVIKENPFLDDVKIKNGKVEEVSLKDQVDLYLECRYTIPDEYMTEEDKKVIEMYRNDRICKMANDFFYVNGNVNLTEQVDVGKYKVEY